jgi:hypothetical protein
VKILLIILSEDFFARSTSPPRTNTVQRDRNP